MLKVKKKEKKQKTIQPLNNREMFLYILLWVMSITCLLVSFIFKEQRFIFFIISCICFILVGSWTILRKLKFKQNKQEAITLPETWPKDCMYEGYQEGLVLKKTNLVQDKNIEFYKACLDFGIINMTSAIEIEKAVMIAKKMKFKEIDEHQVVQMFLDGKQKLQEIEKHSQQLTNENEIISLRIQELKYLRQSMRYFGYHGKEKRMKMLEDLVEKAKSKKNTVLAQIYARKMKETTTKIIDESNSKHIFNYLKIENVSSTVTKSGAVIIEADFTKDDTYRMYKSVIPAIDGIIQAKIMKEKKHIASAYFVLPLEGITKTRHLKTICTKTTNPNEKYTVLFEPIDIWAIEQV